MAARRPPAPPPTPDKPDPPVTERLRVARWRSERFQALGYDEGHADYMALCEADWHYVASLIANGCPLKLAEKLAT